MPETEFDPLPDLGRRAEELRRLQEAADGFGRSITTALKAAVVDGRALDQVLRGLVLRLSDRALSAALQPLGDRIGGFAATLAGRIGTAAGGLLGRGGGGIVPFADGGVVSAPTFFPLADGRTGLAGEAGAEAILPLARGSDGRLGVRGEGGAVNVTLNVTTPDAESFRRSEAQLTAMLARAAGRGRRGL